MRQLRISRIDTNRDPGIPGAVWYGGTGSINEPTSILSYYEQLPEPPQPEALALILPPVAPEPAQDVQHNDHVMTYWTWRLDRLEARRNA